MEFTESDLNELSDLIASKNKEDFNSEEGKISKDIADITAANKALVAATVKHFATEFTQDEIQITDDVSTDGFTSWIKHMINRISTWISETANKSYEWIKSVVEKMKTFVSKCMKWMIKKIEKTIARVKAYIFSIEKKFSEYMDKFLNWLSQNGKELVETLESVLHNLVYNPTLSSFAQTVINSCLSAHDGVGLQLGHIVKHIKRKKYDQVQKSLQYISDSKEDLKTAEQRLDRELKESAEGTREYRTLASMKANVGRHAGDLGEYVNSASSYCRDMVASRN